MVNPMARTSHTGYLRQYGGPGKAGTPAVFLSGIQFDVDPTAASAGTGKFLPRGAIPLFVQNIRGGASGGVSPTLDIGTTGDNDGFANELDADAATSLVVGGALLGGELLVDTEIFAGVGASAATGGTCLVTVWYAMADDGAA